MTTGESITYCEAGTDASRAPTFFELASIDPDCAHVLSQKGVRIAALTVDMWSLGISDRGPEFIQCEVPYMIATLAEKAAHTPPTPLWDYARAYLANTLIEQKEVDYAFQMLAAMDSGYRIGLSIVAANQFMPEHLAPLFEKLAHRLEEQLHNESRVKFIDFSQAIIDAGIVRGYGTIKGQPGNDILSRATEIAALRPGYDIAAAWIASQRELHPGLDWDTIIPSIYNEALWQEAPHITRCYLSNLVLLWQTSLDGDNVGSEQIDAIAQAIERLREEVTFPCALDACHFLLGRHLVREGCGILSLDLAGHIQSPLLLEQFACILEVYGEGSIAGILRLKTTVRPFTPADAPTEPATD